MEAQSGLSNIQLELLKIFSINLGDEQMEEIRLLLMNYFAEKVTKDFDDLFEENGWGEEKIEEWSNEHMRTKYEA
jgi:hypothetical protein